MFYGKKVVPKLRQEVKVKVDIVTSDDIKIYHTGKFQDFTARYIIKEYKKKGAGYESLHLTTPGVSCLCTYLNPLYIGT